MRHLDLFSGIGGFSLAADRVWYEQKNEHIFVEWDDFCQEVIKKHWGGPSSIGTFGNLLPTPESKNSEGYQTAHGKKYPRLGRRISSLEDSPVSLSLKPDEERERQTTATSGRLCLSASLFSDHDGSLLKMFRDSLLGAKAWYSRQCALTWRRKVTKSSRLLFQLLPSKRRIAGTEYGLLPTATTQEVEHPQAELTYTGRRKTKDGKGSHSMGLADRVAMFPTPDSNMGARGEMKEWKPVRPSGHHASLTLNDAVKRLQSRTTLPTPNARDTRGKSIKRDRVPDIVEGHNNRDGMKTGLKLQPAFVEWMMGFPEDWTAIPDSRLLEMRLSRRSRCK